MKNSKDIVSVFSSHLTPYIECKMSDGSYEVFIGRDNFWEGLKKDLKHGQAADVKDATPEHLLMLEIPTKEELNRYNQRRDADLSRKGGSFVNPFTSACNNIPNL